MMRQFALLVLVVSICITSFNTHSAQQNPSSAAISETQRLAIDVLQEPSMLKLFAFNDPEFGIETLRRELPLLNALLDHPDAAEALLNQYESIDLSRFAAAILQSRAAAGKALNSKLAKASLRSLMMEILLTSDTLIGRLTEQHTDRFINAYAEKMRSRAAYPEFFRGPPDTVSSRVSDVSALASNGSSKIILQGAGTSCGPGLGNLEGMVGTAISPGGSEYTFCNVSSEWSSQELSELTNFWQSEYVSTGLASFAAAVTQKYICHSYTLWESIGIDPDLSIDPPITPVQYPFITAPYGPLINDLTTDSSFLRVLDIADGDAVFYTRQGNFYDHSGVPGTACAGSDPEGLGCIESKWGWGGPRMRHYIGNDPYWGENLDINPLNMDPFNSSIDADGARFYISTDKTAMSLDPADVSIDTSAATVVSQVQFSPGSLVDAHWTASIISGQSYAQLSTNSGNHLDDVTVSVNANTSPIERTIVVRVNGTAGDSYTHNYSSELTIIQEGIYVPPCVPATPVLVNWPANHCTQRLNRYDIAPESCAASYEWRVDNPAISLLYSGTTAWVEASLHGTSGRLYWKACNSQGQCSSEDSVHLYFRNCSPGGGRGGGGGGDDGPQDPL